MAKHPETWTESERTLLFLAMKKEKKALYVVLLLDLSYHVFALSDFSILMYCGLALLCVYIVDKSSAFVTSLRWQAILVISYFEVLQCLHYNWAATSPKLAFSYSLSSTVILLTRQVSPMMSRSFNLFLVSKHILAWFLICLCFQGLGTVSPFVLVNLGWALYRMVTYLDTRISMLKTEFEYMESLRRNEKHIKSLYEALPPGIIVVTEDKKVVSYNQAILQCYQLEGATEEMYGKIYECLSQARYLAEYRTTDTRGDSLLDDILEYTLSSDHESKSFGAVLISGRYYEWRVNKLNWDEKKACILCMRDITRWIELETIAKRESDSKSALLRSVSHELRTPTNAIINIVQDIKEKEQLSPESSHDVTMLSSSAQFLLSMINDLLDYSSITNGKFGLTKQFFDLQSTIKECTKLIELQCLHKKLELITRYDPLLPAQAYNDKNRLKQVILNLLSNALKFTITGKIEIVAVSVSETHAGITVTDTGVGISEESLGKIFKLFGKLEGNENLNPQGCGLGLSISSMLVKSMGGAGIHVASQRHVGSTFAFEFNITQSADIPQPVDIRTECTELWENVEKIVLPAAISAKSIVIYPDILVADDVDYNRMVLRNILEYAGYDCDEAPTGIQVIQLVKYRANMGKPYRVILMDVEMPEMDGIAATRELAAMVTRRELESLPIIIGCSAYSSIEDREMCLQAGMLHYLEKPIVREILFGLLSEVVTRTRAHVRF